MPKFAKRVTRFLEGYGLDPGEVQYEIKGDFTKAVLPILPVTTEEHKQDIEDLLEDAGVMEDAQGRVLFVPNRPDLISGVMWFEEKPRSRLPSFLRRR